MLCSYIIKAQSQGHEKFENKIPTIFEIQEYIEEAWDFGINTTGRVETGGIRGTRKYIGTPDVSIQDSHAGFCSTDILQQAQAMFNRLDIA